MGLGDSIADFLAGRARQLIGVGFGCIAVGHFAFWAQGDGGGAEFGNAVGDGKVLAAAPEVATYAANHPAYVVAFLVGAALLVRRQ